MLKALLDRILELSEVRTYQLRDITFTKEQNFSRIRSPEQIPPQTLQFNNLAALVEYLDRIDFDTEKLFYAVMSPTEVSLMASNDPANDNNQFQFATATMNMGNFHFGGYSDLELFIIGLLARFEPTSDRDAVIETLAHLSNDHVIQNLDDKFSQKIKVKTGLTTKAEVEVKNPVVLKPFRTFREVDQPQSEFILRYRNRGDQVEAALFEGDGGSWKLDAIQNIKNWLTENTKIPVIG